MNTIFTGQQIIDTVPDGRGTVDVVPCQKCNGPVSLRVAYIDRYTDAAPAEKYVHFGCLSQQRLDEIRTESQ